MLDEIMSKLILIFVAVITNALLSSLLQVMSVQGYVLTATFAHLLVLIFLVRAQERRLAAHFRRWSPIFSFASMAAMLLGCLINLGALNVVCLLLIDRPVCIRGDIKTVMVTYGWALPILLISTYFTCKKVFQAEIEKSS